MTKNTLILLVLICLTSCFKKKCQECILFEREWYINSLLKNTQPVYDLMVFDNGSCKRIIEYLIDLRDKGIIQYLIFLN